MSINANGQYAFDLIALPTDSLHVNSDFTKGENYTIEAVGAHTVNLQCHRSAYAQVLITNTQPIDTANSLELSTAGFSIKLLNFYKDTLVYLKLVGLSSYTNYISFKKNSQTIYQTQRVVGPWDTIPLQVNY